MPTPTLQKAVGGVTKHRPLGWCGLSRWREGRQDLSKDTHECQRWTKSCPGSASPTPGSGSFPARQCQTGESGRRKDTEVERNGWIHSAADYFGQAALEYLPVFDKQLSIGPKDCASVVQLPILLLRDGPWWTSHIIINFWPDTDKCQLL